MSGVFVEGHCPNGCGRTLALNDESRVICTDADCPDRGLVDELLCEGETDHIVLVSNKGWSITHPLREHGMDLQECPLHRHLRQFDDAPVTPGRYRVKPNGPSWSWQPMWAPRDRGHG
jgi:hypothetical protein